MRDVEIQQIPQFEAAESEIGQHLSHMDWCETLNRLDLDNDFVLDEDINPETRFNPLSVVFDRKGELPGGSSGGSTSGSGDNQ